MVLESNTKKSVMDGSFPSQQHDTIRNVVQFQTVQIHVSLLQPALSKLFQQYLSYFSTSETLSADSKHHIEWMSYHVTEHMCSTTR